MPWFSKSKKEKDSELFLSEFPTRTAIQATKLADELEVNDNNTGWSDLLKNSETKTNLINCFIGAHILYLSMSAEGAITTSLFGEKILEKSLTSLPKKTQAFVIMTLTLYSRKPSIDKDTLLSSLETFYNAKIDPIDAYIAFATEQEVRPSNEFSGLLVGLLQTLHRLQIEQLGWLKEMADKWAVNK